MIATPRANPIRNLDWLLIFAISTLAMIILFHLGWYLHRHAAIPYLAAVSLFSLLATQIYEPRRLMALPLAAFAGTTILMFYVLLFDQVTVGMLGWLYFVCMYYYGAIAGLAAMGVWITIYFMNKLFQSLDRGRDRA